MYNKIFSGLMVVLVGATCNIANASPLMESVNQNSKTTIKNFSPAEIDGLQQSYSNENLNNIDLTPDQYKDTGCSEKISFESAGNYSPTYTKIVNCSESALQTRLLMRNRDLTANKKLEAQRLEYQNIANKGLELLFKEHPNLKQVIESAPGYAVFEVKNYNALIYVAGYGKGMIFDNTNKSQSYIYTVRSGTGLGLGFREIYAIMIFKDHAALVQFDTSKGVGGDVGAAGTFGIWGDQVSFNPYVDTYQINEEGFNIQANWGGTLYFQTPGLNE